jgi:hypothetical protein
MSPTGTRKKFDCVAFKRKAQGEVYEETRGLSPREQLEYFNRRARTGAAAKWWKKVKRAS